MGTFSICTWELMSGWVSVYVVQLMDDRSGRLVERARPCGPFVQCPSFGSQVLMMRFLHFPYCLCPFITVCLCVCGFVSLSPATRLLPVWLTEYTTVYCSHRYVYVYTECGGCGSLHFFLIFNSDFAFFIIHLDSWRHPLTLLHTTEAYEVGLCNVKWTPRC